VACGLCELSYLGIPFSQKYGSRQRFHMILTDAVLPETPLLTKSVCDHCGLCAKVCPLGAISSTETEEIDICGKKMTVAKIDYDLCKRCKNGALPSRFGTSCKPDRVAALCNRTCLCHLEEKKATENQFENSFRQRETWALDAIGRYAERNTEEANVLGGSFSKDGDRSVK